MFWFFECSTFVVLGGECATTTTGSTTEVYNSFACQPRGNKCKRPQARKALSSRPILAGQVAVNTHVLMCNFKCPPRQDDMPARMGLTRDRTSSYLPFE